MSASADNFPKCHIGIQGSTLEFDALRGLIVCLLSAAIIKINKLLFLCQDCNNSLSEFPGGGWAIASDDFPIYDH